MTASQFKKRNENREEHLTYSLKRGLWNLLSVTVTDLQLRNIKLNQNVFRTMFRAQKMHDKKKNENAATQNAFVATQWCN